MALDAYDCFGVAVVVISLLLLWVCWTQPSYDPAGGDE